MPARKVRRDGLLLCGFFCLLFAIPTIGQTTDADSDGMSDEAETVLGSNPKHAETFTVILQRALPEQARDPNRFVTQVAVANAGGNRFVWRIQLGGPYPKENSNMILYLDCDNNPQTGRPEHGCEFMLHVNRGQGSATGFTPTGQAYPCPYPRVWVDPQSVYVSYDVDLKQEGGRSLFRLNVLSEIWEPHQGVDSTGYFAAQGPPISTEPKMRLEGDLTASEGMEQTYGPRTVDPLVSAPENVRLPIFQCTLEGFRFIPSEYRADNVVRAGSPARILAQVPRAGTFYPGFVIHDEAGREVVGLYINGERKGIAVASWDDNDQHLYFLSQPVALKAGDMVELRALSPEGTYRIEDLVLLSRKPTPRPPVYEFRHVEAQEDRLTWITTWPAACTVELGDGRTITEPERLNNHRVVVPDMKPGQTIRYRLVAETREGNRVTTPWRTHTWKPFIEPPTKASGTIPLRVSVPEDLRLTNWPVTSGVPFPQGVLGSAAQLALFDGDGKPVPLQALVTGRWPDGSVKWVLLDFRHSGASATYQLRYGPNIRRAEDASRSVQPTPLGRLVLTDAEGKTFAASLDRLTLEESGPLRTCAYGAGRLQDAQGNGKFAYEVRVHRYPGSPWVRVLLTFGNDVPDAEFTTVRSLRWELPLRTPHPAFVRQHTDDRCVTEAGEEKRWSGPVGCIHVRDFWQNYPLDLEASPDGSVLWLLPPLKPDEYDSAKGTVDEHRLYYWFQSLGDAGGYKLRQGMTKTHEVWLGLEEEAPPYDRPLMAVCPPKWYAESKAFGEIAVADANRDVIREYDAKVAQTLESYLANRERNREFGQFNFGDWWGERVINWGNIEYDTQHAFFLQFIRSGDLRFFQAAEEAERHNRDIDTVHYHADPRRVGKVYAHCIGHVGDYYERSPLPGPDQGTARGGFSDSHTWCEGHCDHFFLTGERRSLETARKIADVYGRYRTLNYDFNNCREPGWHLIFTLGTYRATGDPFYLNAARIIVERVLERQTEQPALGTAGGGWRRRMVPGHCYCEPAHYGNAGFMVGVLLTGLRWYHEETGDPRVARSIHLGARFLIADMWEPSVKGFRYTSCPKSSAGAWSNFLLFDGIGYAYRLTKDKELARILMAGTDSAIASMSGMGKSFSQYIRVAPHFIGLLADLREKPVMPIARFQAVTPEPLSGTSAVRFDASPSRWPQGSRAQLRWDFGDGTTATGRQVTHTYARGGRYTVKLTVTCGTESATTEEQIAVPPLPLLTAPRERVILVEAEHFSAQEGGQVKVPTGRVGASGAIVTGWEETIGHWLEWKVRVPQAGRYRLVLKYCSGSPNPRRALTLDGQVPAEACREIAFPPTGGYSVGTNRWNYLTLGGEENPCLLDLSAGEHTLRLTNLGDGLGLDWIALVRE